MTEPELDLPQRLSDKCVEALSSLTDGIILLKRVRDAWHLVKIDVELFCLGVPLEAIETAAATLPEEGLEKIVSKATTVHERLVAALENVSLTDFMLACSALGELSRCLGSVDIDVSDAFFAMTAPLVAKHRDLSSDVLRVVFLVPRAEEDGIKRIPAGPAIAEMVDMDEVTKSLVEHVPDTAEPLKALVEELPSRFRRLYSVATEIERKRVHSLILEGVTGDVELRLTPADYDFSYHAYSKLREDPGPGSVTLLTARELESTVSKILSGFAHVHGECNYSVIVACAFSRRLSGGSYGLGSTLKNLEPRPKRLVLIWGSGTRDPADPVTALEAATTLRGDYRQYLCVHPNRPFHGKFLRALPEKSGPGLSLSFSWNVSESTNRTNPVESFMYHVTRDDTPTVAFLKSLKKDGWLVGPITYSDEVVVDFDDVETFRFSLKGDRQVSLNVEVKPRALRTIVRGIEIKDPGKNLTVRLKLAYPMDLGIDPTELIEDPDAVRWLLEAEYVRLKPTFGHDGKLEVTKRGELRGPDPSELRIAITEELLSALGGEEDEGEETPGDQRLHPGGDEG